MDATRWLVFYKRKDESDETLYVRIFQGRRNGNVFRGEFLKIEDTIDLGNDHFRVLSTSF